MRHRRRFKETVAGFSRSGTITDVVEVKELKSDESFLKGGAMKIRSASDLVPSFITQISVPQKSYPSGLSRWSELSKDAVLLSDSGGTTTSLAQSL